MKIEQSTPLSATILINLMISVPKNKIKITRLPLNRFDKRYAYLTRRDKAYRHQSNQEAYQTCMIALLSRSSGNICPKLFWPSKLSIHLSETPYYEPDPHA